MFSWALYTESLRVFSILIADNPYVLLFCSFTIFILFAEFVSFAEIVLFALVSFGGVDV